MHEDDPRGGCREFENLEEIGAFPGVVTVDQHKIDLISGGIQFAKDLGKDGSGVAGAEGHIGKQSIQSGGNGRVDIDGGVCTAIKRQNLEGSP